MENANKFKVVRDINVLDCSTPYMFEKTKKRIADKYKGLGIADDAMLAKLWENVEVDYSQFMYPTVVDFELTNYDTKTVNAAFNEIGDLYGEVTDNNGEEIPGIDLYNEVDQLPVFIGNNNNYAGYYSLKIIAFTNDGSDNGTTLYSSIGWGDSRKDKEVAVETLQKGKPFFWSFVNWVKNYIGISLNFFKSTIGQIYEELNKGVPAATLTEKGAVKMAGKVDALADGATLAQAVERLNTLIAQLKSAGIMSKN